MNTLKELEKLLLSLAAIRETHKGEMSKLEGKRELYSGDYFEKQKKKLLSEYKSIIQADYLKLLELLTQLDSELQELNNGAPDLKNAELTNAIKIIEGAGSALEYRQLFEINSAFHGKLPELRILEATYKKLGMVNNGGIEKFLLSSAYSGQIGRAHV
jgi:hypothetical protein